MCHPEACPKDLKNTANTQTPSLPLDIRKMLVSCVLVNMCIDSLLLDIIKMLVSCVLVNTRKPPKLRFFFLLEQKHFSMHIAISLYSCEQI